MLICLMIKKKLQCNQGRQKGGGGGGGGLRKKIEIWGYLAVTD